MRIGLLISLLCWAVLALADERVTVAWDRNIEPDVCDYTVYWGTNSGAYSWQTNSANNTNVVVVGLQQGVTYYFVVTAWNTSGLESDYSIEVSYTVPTVPVMDPVTLTVGFEASSDLGSWQPVGVRLTVTNAPRAQFYRMRIQR